MTVVSIANSVEVCLTKADSGLSLPLDCKLIKELLTGEGCGSAFWLYAALVAKPVPCELECRPEIPALGS